MVSPGTFSRLGQIYLWSVISAGIAVLVVAVTDLNAHPISLGWLILASLTLVSGSATLHLPSSYASISISETFVFAAALLYGPSAAAATVSLDALAISFWLAKRHRGQIHRALFNISAPVISAWLSATAFFAVSGVAPLAVQPSSVSAILPSVYLFAFLYFTVNSWLVTFIIALERHLSAIAVWRSSFVWLSLNYFGGASVAILFVGFTRKIDIGYLGIILPLLVVLYFTFKTTMGRVEDANKHVAQLNKLYLSTIETLAMAIDAKDQVTHGHIRRVQQYAIRLAHAIGVRDTNLIKAVEAAALLHDMGKLAVPEHILNKPGKLTPAEFERMKLHASIGADILSAIEFPYPVVPIVRHHHENWDGSGYPQGLRGTDIPIGARILAVVDCFDALTSDRPYRPKMSHVEAIHILHERRGTMYDPLIVDTFCRIHRELESGSFSRDGSTNALEETIGTQMPIRLNPSEQAAPPGHAMAPIGGNCKVSNATPSSFADNARIADAAAVIANSVRHMSAVNLTVFYLSDGMTNHIQAVYAVGDGSEFVKGLRIPIGQRLSGWVAANCRPIVNSDPALDLVGINQMIRPSFKSCISTPLLMDDNSVIGVLTLYSSVPDAFGHDAQSAVAAAAQQFGEICSRTLNVQAESRGLNSTTSAQQLADAVASWSQSNRPFVLLLIDISHSMFRKESTAADEVYEHVARIARRNLRTSDCLFRYNDSFVALATTVEPVAAYAISKRIESAVTSLPIQTSQMGTVSISVSIGIAYAPTNGVTLEALLAAASRDTRGFWRNRTATSIH